MPDCLLPVHGDQIVKPTDLTEKIQDRSTSPPRSRGIHCRRGTAYVMVLVVSMIVTIVGVTSITLARIQTRQSVQVNDWAEAQVLAASGIEQTLCILNANEDWRKIYTQGAVAQTHNLGNGTYKWRLYDNVDGDFTDNPTDAMTLQVIATVNETNYRLSVDLAPTADNITLVKGSWEQIVN